MHQAGQITRTCQGGPSGRDSDRGFTLIELLIVLVVLPLIIGGVAAAVIVIMNNTIPTDRQGTAARLADSHDAQITSAYLVRDVQSATSASTFSTPVCNGAAGNYQLLGLEWNQTGATIDVSYSVQRSPLQLVRYFCSGGVLTSTSVISHDVFIGLTSVAIVPTGGAGCLSASSCAVSGGTTYVSVNVNCTDGSITCVKGGLTPVLKSSGKAGVTNIQMTVLDNTVTKYTYNLTAAPRLASSGTTGQPPSNPNLNPPFIVNGPIGSGNCNLLVKVMMAVNDSSSGAVAIGNGQISSTCIYTLNPTPSTSVTTKPLGKYPTPVTSGGYIHSPYDLLAEKPSNPNGPPSPPATAPTYSIVTENKANWDPSGDTSVHVGGDLTKPLIPAIYRITNGMTLKKGVNGSNGVLFYVVGGNVSLGGNGVVNLAPLDANPVVHGWEQTTDASPAPTPEVVVWVSASDTGATLTLGGNGNVTTITGALYAPTASVTMNGGGAGGGVNVQSLDVGTVSACNGGGAVPWDFTIGNHAASGTFDNPTIQTIVMGKSDTDTTSVIGSISPDVPPTGNVTFSVCGPEDPTLGCAPGNPNLVKSWSPTVALTATPNSSTSTATSTAFTPTSAGWYCFAVVYGGDSNYNGSSDTSPDGCFAAGPPQISISSPTSGTCYGTLPSLTCPAPTTWPLNAISGTTTDPLGPGVSGVTLTVQDAKGKYWDPSTSSFSSSSPVPISATDTAPGNDWSTWSYPFPVLDFPNGDAGTYAIVATVTDKGTPSQTGTASINFKWGG